MADVNQMLDTNLDEVRPPQPVPGGTYILCVNDHEIIESREKKTPGVQFDLGIASVCDDVPSEAVQDYEQAAGEPITAKHFKNNQTTFWLSPKALFMLKDFLEKCGVNTKGRPIKAALGDVKGCTVKAVIGQTVSNRPGDTSVFNEIQSWLPAE